MQTPAPISVQVIITCIHCHRRQLLTVAPGAMIQFDHAYSCECRRLTLRKQLAYRQVPGKPTDVWEDGTRYPVYEVGIFRIL